MADDFRTENLDWEDLRFAAALGACGSLAGAARQLGVTHSTVGRRLAALEAALGRILFERRPLGWTPTPAGREVMATAQRMGAQAAALHRQLTAEPVGLTGTVRVTSTDGIARDLVGPTLARLARDHRGLTFEVLVDDRRLSLARGEADIALRWTRPREGALRARRLATWAQTLCRHPDAIPPLPLATFDETLKDTPESRWLAAHYPDHPVALRSNRLGAIEQAIRAGAAMGLLPPHRQAGLQPIPVPHALPIRALWMAVHQDLANVPRILLVRRALAEAAAHLGRSEETL